MTATPKLLFVCTGNICRSPMAVGIMRQQLRVDGLEDQVMVTSAGVRALDGRRASPPAVAVLAEQRIDITDHIAHTISVEELHAQDVVLVMEEQHRRSLFYLAPEESYKVYLLSEMSGQHIDIADPYGQDESVYTATAALLSELIRQGLPRIYRLLGVSAASLRQ